MDEIIDGIIAEIWQLPNRVSPDQTTEMMLVTETELRTIIEAAFANAHPDGQETQT